MMKLAPLSLLCCLSSLSGAAAASPSGSARGRDSAALLDRLIARMTLEEKCGQLNQYSAGQPTGPGTHRNAYETMIASGQVGSLLNVTRAGQANAYQKIALEQSRLQIPLLFGLDVIHGFRTIFPVNLGLSATWDPTLVEETSRVAATEAAAEGIRWTFAPMVDIARDARWGRIAESAGEDPYLGSAFARAYIRGYQGRRLDEPTSILACAKHFVGYGAAEGGRDYNTTEISERSLRQLYLVPFHASVEAGVGSFMSAFNALDGVPASANAFTTRELLRKEWRFGGFVVSDWGAIAETILHGTASDGAMAARKSFLAGVDMDMESGLYLSHLPALVRAGAIPLREVDDAVRRILRMKLALGLFEHPYAPVAEALEARLEVDAASRRLARRAAEESFVLLENAAAGEPSRPVLPLAAAPGRRIALLGPLADSADDMLGCWSAQGVPGTVVTLRMALTARTAAEGMTLLYARGAEILGDEEFGFDEALGLARQADVVILALGEKGDRTGEDASRAHLDLERGQERLLEAVQATGKPVVLVLFSGRPLTIGWAAQHVPAIVAAWFPGVEAGPALVRTLFGDVNPSGRLTATWPRAVGQEPLYYNSLNTGRPKPPVGSAAPFRFTSRYIDELNAPLYPFGHGLSYTTFAYSPTSTTTPKVSAAAIQARGASVRVSAEVTNSGPRAGTEVVQCYIRLTGTSVARPVRELEGFARVTLAPGETRRIEFALSKEELSFWNLELKRVVEPSRLEVWVAPDSTRGASASVIIEP